MSIYKELLSKKKLLSVTGLGYVGLPLALEFARHFKVIAYDINPERIKLMQKGIDPSRELNRKNFSGCDIEFTSNPEVLKHAHFHVVSVPTDIDEHKVPNLKPLIDASIKLGKVLKKGDYIVFESTVYPGCTEEDCVPILEIESGLRQNIDFKYGYSPERIVPGEKIKTLTKILKIVSGSDKEALEEISKIYGQIIEGGLHKASSIMVAEAAKVIENTQRDINISLMNELAIIFDRLGIDTNEVIDAAATKWNFHKYTPGLVGGHCIGVDPYYLIHKSRQLGHDPQVIAAGRRVNDYIPNFIAKKLVQTLIENGKNPGKCKVLVLGITFKANVSDIRNSKIASLIYELKDYSLNVHVTDPLADVEEVKSEYGIQLNSSLDNDYDAIILAVGHNEYLKFNKERATELSSNEPILFDINGVLKHMEIKNYWKL